MGLNVLIINLDSSLSVDEDCVMGNAKARHIEYAKHLDNLYIIVKTSRCIKRKVKKIRENIFIYPSASLNRYLFLFDAFNLASRICRENKIDLIISQDPFVTGIIGWLIKRKYGIPLNIQIAADMIENKYFIKESIFNLFFNKLAKRIIRKADTIRVSSIREKETLITLGIDKEKIYYVPFFIDFQSFQQIDGESTRRANLKNRFDKIILSISRLVKQKNIETIIRAIPYIIEKYPKCLFLIVGSGPQEKRLRKLASDLGVEGFIKFQKQVCYKDAPRYFQAADIFVSTSYYEGTCMTIQEAAAVKKPIISTPHNGALDVVKDGFTGFIIDFEDFIGLSKKILYLIENPLVAEDAGRRGSGFAIERFNKEKISRDYLKMCEATVKRGE